MDFAALIGATTGLTGLVLTIIYGNKIENKMLRYLVGVLGMVVSIGLAGQISGALSARDNIDASYIAGRYLFFLAICAIILKKIVFKKKNKK